MKAAKFLMSCYRPSDVNDPEVYIQAVSAVLGMYPKNVVVAVVDPRCGLPARLKWLPTVAEVKESCEVEMRPIYRQREWDRQSEERRNRISSTTHERPSFNELKDRYGPNWGLKTTDDLWKPPPLEKMCADAGVTVEEFEAINDEALKWVRMAGR